jgi:hypothetical protein
MIGAQMIGAQMIPATLARLGGANPRDDEHPNGARATWLARHLDADLSDTTSRRTSPRAAS